LPKTVLVAGAVMPRFVILEHDHPERHFDLMLEAGATLRTWRLPALPIDGATITAEESFPHRLVYLDYEGPVSGNRGSVIRRQSGEFREIARSADDWVVAVPGGTLTLRRVASSAWTCQFLAGDGGRSTV